MIRRFAVFLVLSVACLWAWSDYSAELNAAPPKSKIVRDFEPVCDSLDSLILERIGVKSDLTLRAVMKRGNALDFYFTVSLSDIPWQKGDPEWFAKQLRVLMPENYKNFSVGNISAPGVKMSELVVGRLGFSGEPDDSRYRIRKVPKASRPWVEKKDKFEFENGLEGRHIALWQSHGLYFDNASERWRWQRPRLFHTTEDALTQSFVIPYLAPMLENAGAYVMLPRERGYNPHEIIIDNDPYFSPETDTTLIYDVGGQLRSHGVYSETGTWTDAGTGFADAKAVYTGTDNPFTMGTARSTDCIKEETRKLAASLAVWTPDIPEDGEYAVYVSYKTLPESTESAKYSVVHAGGGGEFIVNQKIGGGTWVYLGTFPFRAGKGYIVLSNETPHGRKFVSGTKVCADAVKIGSGLGNIARSANVEAVPETSGLPRYLEGARYWLQWAGADTTVYKQSEDSSDYKDDLMSRGDWETYLSGGSDVAPKAEKGKGVPFDLTLALHTDAGTYPNDSIVGTLAIYSRESDGRKVLPSGESMATNRDYANLVQSQIVHDLRASFDSTWSRRQIWNRGYRESRTPSSPAMLVELLSHQNFADMRYGHDPSFKFTASRAIYKGMLKYLSNRYGRDYVVQPLPVRGFSANLVGDKVVLEWSAGVDELEPTAVAEGFLVQVAKNEKGFNVETQYKASDILVAGSDSEAGLSAGSGAASAAGPRYRVEVPIKQGVIYRFKVRAYNSGGISFDSEILAAGRPFARATESAVTDSGAVLASAADSCVLIVNNFDRLSAPAWFDFGGRAGFNCTQDSGVPYMRETAFVGEMYLFDRSEPWTSDDNPGFGASHNDMAGTVIAGNTFDYPYKHGKAIFDCGYAFCSASSEAFVRDSSLRAGKWCADLICGKQVRTLKGNISVARAGDVTGEVQGSAEAGVGYAAGDARGDVKYAVFPREMREALSSFTAGGGNLIVSGSYIGTDVWDRVYPIVIDSLERDEEIKFAEKVLGYRWQTGHGGRSGKVRVVHNPEGVLYGATRELSYNNAWNERVYRVENPDGIGPADKNSQIFLRYADTRIAAGIVRDSGSYKTVCVGFPIETVTDENSIKLIFDSSFKFFRKK